MCDGGFWQNETGATSCRVCLAGHYCPEAASAALPCKAGRFSQLRNLSQSSECQRAKPGFFAVTGSLQEAECSPGTFTDVVGEASCTRCAPGKYQVVAGTTRCNECTAGYYCEEGAAAALPCPGGTHTNATLRLLSLPMTSVEQCVICPEGTFCSVGSDAATPCAPGTYNAQTNATTCVSCARGSFQNASHATACQSCDSGHFCPSGASTPLPCVAGTFNPLLGMESEAACIPCLAGHSCVLGSTSPTPCSPGVSQVGLKPFSDPSQYASDVSQLHAASNPLHRPWHPLRAWSGASPAALASTRMAIMGHRARSVGRGTGARATRRSSALRTPTTRSLRRPTRQIARAAQSARRRERSTLAPGLRIAPARRASTSRPITTRRAAKSSV